MNNGFAINILIQNGNMTKYKINIIKQIGYLI